MIALVVAVAVSLIVSALCSLIEAVLYSVPLSHIEMLRKKGHPSGERLARLRANIDQPITAVLTLNTIANTAGASIAGSFAANVFNDTGMILFAILFTAAILFFSEILPKTVGVVYCRTLAQYIAQPLQILLVLLKPLIVATGFVTRLVASPEKASPATEDDICALAALSRRAGSIKASEEKAIRNILALDNRRVTDIMTPRTVVHMLSAKTTAKEAHANREFWHYSRVPVYGADREDIIGIAHRSDIMEALTADNDHVTLERLMKPVHFVPETMPLDRLLAQFLDQRTHLYVVLDEYGGMAGVVSLEDVIEEILGREIMDETDSVADLQELARKRRANVIAAAYRKQKK